jgi:hypothetical protein
MASNISDDKKKAAKAIDPAKSGFKGRPLGVAASAASSWPVVTKEPGAIQGVKNIQGVKK